MDSPSTINQELVNKAWALAFGLTGRASDAEDVVQQSLMVLHNKRAEVQRSAWSYLAGIITLQVKQHRRSEARLHAREKLYAAQAEKQNPGDGHDPLRQLLQDELRQQLWQAFGELPAEEREALAFTLISGFSRREAAKLVGVSTATLSRRIRSGLETLRARIKVEKKDVAPLLGVLPLLFPAAPNSLIVSVAEGSSVAATAKVSVGLTIKKAAALLFALGVVAVALFFAFDSSVGDIGGSLLAERSGQESGRTDQSAGVVGSAESSGVSAEPVSTRDEVASASLDDNTTNAPTPSEEPLLHLIKGRVVDRHENPIAGAKVGINYQGAFTRVARSSEHPLGVKRHFPDTWKNLKGSALSGEDGSFSLRVTGSIAKRTPGSLPTLVSAPKLVTSHPDYQPTYSRGSFAQGVEHEIIIPLFKPSSISGSVVDEEGNPVTNAIVHASENNTSWQSRKMKEHWDFCGLNEVRETVADEKGRFTLSGMRAGSWTLGPVVKGSCYHEFAIKQNIRYGKWVVVQGNYEKDVQLTLENFHTLELHIANDDIGEIEVVLFLESIPGSQWIDSSYPIQLAPESDGVFRYRGYHRSALNALVSARGYRMKKLALVPNAKGDAVLRDVELERAYPLQVRVVDSRGFPIPGAKVGFELVNHMTARESHRLYGLSLGRSRFPHFISELNLRWIADQSGRAQIDVPLSGEHYIAAHHEGYAPHTQMVIVREETISEVQTITLQEAGGLKFTMEGERPSGVESYKEAVIYLISQQEYKSAYELESQHPSREKRFVSLRLPENQPETESGTVFLPDSYVPLLRYGDYSLKGDAVEIEAGEVAEISLNWADARIAEDPGATVHGTITGREGNPMAHTKVWVSPSERFVAMFNEVQTDAAGQYRIEGVQAGTQYLLIESDLENRERSLDDEAQRRQFEVPSSGEVEKNLDFSIKRGATIRGYFLVNGEEPFDYANLYMRIPRQGGATSFRNVLRFNEDGSFEWLDVPPGRCTVMLYHRIDGKGAGVCYEHSFISPQSMEDVVIERSVRGFPLKGKVEVAGTQPESDEPFPFPATKVEARRVDPDRVSLVRPETLRLEKDGTFAFPFLFEGEYDVVVICPGQVTRVKRLNLRAGIEDLRLPVGGESGSLKVSLKSLGPDGPIGPVRGSWRPLGGRVMLYDRSGRELIECVNNTDKYRRDQFDNPGDSVLLELIPPGDYLLKARVAGYERHLVPVTIRANQTKEVSLDFRRCGEVHIEFSVKGATGKQDLKGAKIFFSRPDEAEEQSHSSYFYHIEGSRFGYDYFITMDGEHRYRIEMPGCQPATLTQFLTVGVKHRLTMELKPLAEKKLDD